MSLPCIYCDEFEASKPDGTCNHCESLPGAPLDERGDEPEGEAAVHVVYRIVHVPSERWYCGVHRLPDGWDSAFKCDGYMGSGEALRAMRAKYPAEEFRKDVLLVLDSGAAAFEVERGLIGAEQVANPRCLNLCEGGGSPVGLSEESRAKMSASLREHYADPAAREAAGERAREWMADPDKLARLRAGIDDRTARPEWRENLADANRRPEVRAARGESSRRAWADATPEERAARVEAAAEGGRGPEAKERHRAGMRSYWASERRAAHVENLGAANRRPERRAQMSASQRRRYEDPAERAKVAERSRLGWANATPEQRAARIVAQQEGRRRAKAKRERVRQETAMLFLALVLNKYGDPEAAV